MTSSFKFPTVSHPHQPLQSWSCQLRKYHWSWRLMPSLRQILCTQRAAVMIPAWRSGSSITKLQRCQTDIWLTRNFLSYFFYWQSPLKTKPTKKLSTALNWQAVWAEVLKYVSTLQYFWLKKKMVAVSNVLSIKEHASGEKRIMVLTKWDSWRSS